MKIQNALVSNIFDRSQRYFAHVTTVTLSWRVQNIVVIGRVYFTLECFEFSSNFEFDRNMLSGTGAWSKPMSLCLSSEDVQAVYYMFLFWHNSKICIFVYFNTARSLAQMMPPDMLIATIPRFHLYLAKHLFIIWNNFQIRNVLRYREQQRSLICILTIGLYKNMVMWVRGFAEIGIFFSLCFGNYFWKFEICVVYCIKHNTCAFLLIWINFNPRMNK